MSLKVALALIALLAWYMAVWHIAQGRGWLRHQRLVVFYVGGWVLLLLVHYLTR